MATSIRDTATNTALVPGANELVFASWGFRQIDRVTGRASSQLVNGAAITAMNASRSSSA